MTDEKIKKIAREFAEYSLSEEKKMYDDETYQRLVDESSKGLFDVRYILQWLSKDYCIVSKELVRKEYEKAKSTHELYTSATCINEMESRAIDHAEGRMCELNTLFGKDMFEEEGKL